MTDGAESLLLSLCVLWFLVAGGLEAWLRARKHPRQPLYSWMMWTSLAMLFLGSACAGGGANGVVIVVVALLAGPIAYPVVSAMAGLYLRLNQPARQEMWDDLQRARYRPTDFGHDGKVPPSSDDDAADPGADR